MEATTVEQAFHYPPELFELLVDVMNIPVRT
jgi:hypothetical protein